MIKTCLIVAAIIFIATPATCQNRSVKWGGLVEEGYRSGQTFIGKDKATGTSYWLYFKKHDIWFSSFDRNNTRMRNHVLDYSHTSLTHLPSFQDGVYLRGKIYMLVTSTGKLYLHELDKNGNVITRLIELPDHGYEYSSGALRLTPDSTRVVVFNQLLNLKDNDMYESLTFVDPARLTINSNRIVAIPAGHELGRNWNFTVSDYEVDNEGNILMESWLSGKRIKLNQYWLLRPNDTALHEITIPRDGKTIGKTSLDIDKKGRFLVAGFFSWSDETVRKAKPGGLIFGHVDVEQASILDLKITEMNDTVSRSNPVTFDYNNEQTTAVKEDGGLVLMTEQVRVTSKSIRSNGIHVVSTDSAGNVIYNVAVPTYQTVYLSLYTKYIDLSALSFFSIYNDITGDLTLIYNSNKKNADSLSDPVMPLASARSAMPVLATIRADGEVKYEVIDRVGHNEILLESVSSVQTSPHEAIIVGEKDKKWCVGTLTLASGISNTVIEDVSNEPFTVTQKTGSVGFHYKPRKLKKTYMSKARTDGLFFIGMNIGYATIPKNNLGDWFQQNNIPVNNLNAPVLESSFLFILAVDRLAFEFEMGSANSRNDQITRNDTWFFGLSAGYHLAGKKGTHFLLMATIGGSESTFGFYDKSGPVNIQSLDRYYLTDSRYMAGVSAKFFKSTGIFLGSGLDVGIRYHFGAQWWYGDDPYGDLDVPVKDSSIPHLNGFSFYVYVPIGLCFDGRRR